MLPISATAANQFRRDRAILVTTWGKCCLCTGCGVCNSSLSAVSRTTLLLASSIFSLLTADRSAVGWAAGMDAAAAAVDVAAGCAAGCCSYQEQWSLSDASERRSFWLYEPLQDCCSLAWSAVLRGAFRQALRPGCSLRCMRLCRFAGIGKLCSPNGGWLRQQAAAMMNRELGGHAAVGAAACVRQGLRGSSGQEH